MFFRGLEGPSEATPGMRRPGRTTRCRSFSSPGSPSLAGECSASTCRAYSRSLSPKCRSAALHVSAAAPASCWAARASRSSSEPPMSSGLGSATRYSCERSGRMKKLSAFLSRRDVFLECRHNRNSLHPQDPMLKNSEVAGFATFP